MGVLKDQVQHLLLQSAAMAKIYQHLTTQERAVVMTMRADQCSTRSIAALGVDKVMVTFGDRIFRHFRFLQTGRQRG